ncbi:MAG: class I SAM-dependent methyltransferase [Bacteroidota bacterium]
MNFQDHFSRQSEIYLKARPTYPEELFGYLASMSPSRDLCWDCATGNGQAAVSLSKYFKMVIATDGSEKQIKNGIVKDRIEYKVATAEHSNIENSSADLITSATAAHWFNHDLFYQEAERVAKPNGILALWTYSEAKISDEIDRLMDWFMYDFLYDYWPDARWYVRNRYETLPFPFKSIQTPAFFCSMNWNREQWLNYVKSWSAYNNYVAKHNSDPIKILLPKLNLLWNDSKVNQIIWPLHLKCAILNKLNSN